MITIGSMSAAASSSYGVGSALSAASDPASAALKAANDRVSQQLGSTQVKLSAFGQIKNAFAQVENAAQGLTKLKSGATANELSSAVGAFVNAYNQANGTVNSETKAKSASSAAGALSSDVRARLAGNDLQRALTRGDTASSLAKIGITRSKDGSLAVDNKALQNALQANPEQVRSTLAAIGAQVETTASRELGSGGHVGSSVNALASRASELTTQQSRQQISAAVTQLSNAQTGSLFSSGVAAYQQMLGM